MLKIPITCVIKAGYQSDSNLLKPVLESIRTTEDQKILVKDLTCRKTTEIMWLTCELSALQS